MRRHRGSRGGKEPGHDLARPRSRGIEARRRTEIGQAVEIDNSLHREWITRATDSRGSRNRSSIARGIHGATVVTTRVT
jgi:hypothetical protein